jgi:hypothetical protein
LSAAAISRLIEIGSARHQMVGTFEDSGFTMPTDEELAILTELQDKDFVRFSEEPDRFFEFFRALPMKRDDRYLSDRILYLPERPLSQAEAARLQRYGYELSPQGKVAFEAIQNEVIAQWRDAQNKEKSAGGKDES